MRGGTSREDVYFGCLSIVCPICQGHRASLVWSHIDSWCLQYSCNATLLAGTPTHEQALDFSLEHAKTMKISSEFVLQLAVSSGMTQEMFDSWRQYRALSARLALKNLPKHHAMGHAIYRPRLPHPTPCGSFEPCILYLCVSDPDGDDLPGLVCFMNNKNQVSTPSELDPLCCLRFDVAHMVPGGANFKDC